MIDQLTIKGRNQFNKAQTAQTVKNSLGKRTDLSNLRIVFKMAYPLGAELKQLQAPEKTLKTGKNKRNREKTSLGTKQMWEKM